MEKMLSLVVLLLIASVGALSQTKTVPHDFCSEYEVLHTTPPCCEATCDYDCCRVVCPKMLVYEPTCVCLEGYVRHNGQCIPKSHCPALPTVKPSPCETTTVPSCETTTPPPPPCTTTTPAPCTSTKPPCTTTKPPCPSTKPPCSTPKLPYVLTTPKTYGYTPPSRAKYPPVTYVPPPPSPTYQTVPPYRYLPASSSSRVTPKVTPYQTMPTLRPKPCVTTMKPPCTATVQLPPCTKTKPPCPSTPAPTTTPCPPPTTTPPPTTAPCSKPPEPCAACEELVFVQPCCEPTCDFDCSNTAAACPLVLVQQPTCACRPGLVRYQGHCIEPSACPKSASRYRLYVPVAAQCLKCGK